MINLHPGDRVLFTQLRAMGDTLLCTPAIRDFKRCFPEVELDFLTESLPAQILKNNPRLRRVWISPPANAKFSDYIQLMRFLRRENYSCAVDFLSLPKTAAMMFFTGAKDRLGYRLRGRSWAFTDPQPRRREIIYNPLTKYDLLGPLGIAATDPMPEVFPDAEDERWAELRWVELNLPVGKPLIAFAPWSKREWRRWPLEEWAKLVVAVDARMNAVWLLFGSEGERSALRELEKQLGERIRWAQPADLLKAAALMKRCRLYVGADNGLKHIAVAAGIPTFTLYTDYPGVAPQAWNPPEDGRHRFLIAGREERGIEERILEMVNDA